MVFLGSLPFRYFLCVVFLLCLSKVKAAEEEHFRLGNIYLEAQEVEKALIEFREAEIKDPFNAQLYNNIGYAYYLKEELATSEKYYKKALALSPRLAVTYNNLGVIYQKQKNYLNASQYYEKALGIEPSYAKAAYNLAVTYYRQGHYLKAARQYLKAKKINSSYGEQRFQRERVIKSIEEELQSHPENKDLRRILKTLKNSPLKTSKDDF